jgi:hypothetical protein
MSVPPREQENMNRRRRPDEFPRMKVRGARRRRQAPYDRAGGAFRRLGEAMNRTVGTIRVFIPAVERQP